MMSKSKDMWRTLRNLNKTNKESVPNMIIEERSTVTSSKKMAEIFNCFYINKIKGIREKFKSSKVDTLEILEHLILKTKARFCLPYITVEETVKMIRNMKT